MMRCGYLIWDTEDKYVFVFAQGGVTLFRQDGSNLEHIAYIKHGTFARVVQAYSNWLIHGSKILSKQITELDREEEEKTPAPDSEAEKKLRKHYSNYHRLVIVEITGLGKANDNSGR